MQRLVANDTLTLLVVSLRACGALAMRPRACTLSQGRRSQTLERCYRDTNPRASLGTQGSKQCAAFMISLVEPA